VNQKELLQSGVVSVFITHGGYSSITEASNTKVPFIILPVIGDQPQNGDMYSNLGAALVISRVGGVAS
jgi:UDP:flavonoid glycosyltransferase YjiC (YdhE family)